MTRTREILETSPAPSGFDVEDLAAAIDACLECVQTCTTCADADVAEEDVAAMRRCIGLCLDCADACTATARVLSRSSLYDALFVQRLLGACTRASASCAEECARHAQHHRHCAICEEVCRSCERACKVLLDAEAFAELQALAGG